MALKTETSRHPRSPLFGEPGAPGVPRHGCPSPDAQSPPSSLSGRASHTVLCVHLHAPPRLCWASSHVATPWVLARLQNLPRDVLQAAPTLRAGGHT